MSKTPVSILQEMMVKKQLVPNYELIHDGGGTHMNTFTYQVTCDGHRASGTGRSKKDAKHEAAHAMLKVIASYNSYPQLPAAPEEPVRTPIAPVVPEPQRIPPSVPFLNAVGILQDLCVENNLQEPEYVQISDIGPPHAKIFTIECRVAAFKEVGISRTKKQAKQDAAKKMVDKINDLVADMKDIDSPDSEEEEKMKEETRCNDIAKSRYLTLSRLPTTKKLNLGFKVSEYHLKIRNSFSSEAREQMIEKLKSLIPPDHSDISEEFVEYLSSEFKDFLSKIDLDISSMSLESDILDSHITVMRINTVLDIVQVGLGKTKVEAEFYTLLKLINSMIFLLE